MLKYPRLNVGAGKTARGQGYINADLHPGDNVDVVFDATKPWPFKDNSIGAVHASHVLEHLPELWGFFREAWRVLVPSQMPNLYFQLPYGPSIAGFGDITHLRQYVPASFACFQPGYGDAVQNPQFNKWGAPFSVISIYLRVNPQLRWLLKPVVRRWGVRALDFIFNSYTEMIVGMRALKSQQDIDKWVETQNAGVVPIAHVIYEHEYQGRKLKEGEQPVLRYFTC